MSRSMQTWEDEEFMDEELLPTLSPLIVIDKLELLYAVQTTNFRTLVDRLFIELSTESGLINDEARTRINLMSSHPAVSEELKELFRPMSSDMMTYAEFIQGINSLLTSYAMRSPAIQEMANIWVMQEITLAEMSLGREMKQYRAILRAKSDSMQSIGAAESIKKKSTHSETLGTEKGLFRSASTGNEQFSVAYNDFFVMNEDNTRLLNSCFADFFVRDNGQASVKREEATTGMLFRYKRLWELFAGGDGIVLRSTFIAGMKLAAETYMATSQFCLNTAFSYLHKKVTAAHLVLDKIRDTDNAFVSGARVMFQSYSYQERLPAVIDSVSDCQCGRLNCGKVYTLRLWGDPTGELHTAKVHQLFLAGPTDNFDESVSREKLMKSSIILDKSDAAYERDSYDILHSLKPRFGGQFKFAESDITAVKSTTFEYFFTIGDVKQSFYFDKFDYGITFEKFLFLDCMDATYFEPSRLDRSACAKEPMRCFFLHVGLAVGIHPFALMVAFRKLATQLLAKPPAPDDNEEAKGNFLAFNSDPLSSVLARGDFVDCMVLNAIWPREFDEYQVLIVNLDRQGGFNASQGFTHIRPPNSTYIDSNGDWAGKDILLALHDGHFTLLRPDQTRNVAKMKSHPIATMLEHARRCDYLIAQPNFTMFPDLFPTQFLPDYRVSLFDTLDRTLSAPQPPEPPPFFPSSGGVVTEVAGGGGGSSIPKIQPSPPQEPPISSSTTASSISSKLSVTIESITESLSSTEIREKISPSGSAITAVDTTAMDHSHTPASETTSFGGASSGIGTDPYAATSSVYTIGANNNIYFSRNLYDIPVTISNDMDVSQISNPKPS